MRGLSLLLAGFLSLGMLGCAVHSTVTPTPPPAGPPQNSAIYNAPLEETWDAAIRFVGENFYSLDHVNKDSRIISFPFTTKEPAEYINCGGMSIANRGAGYDSDYNVVFAKALSQYRVSLGEGTIPQPFVRRTTLSGNVNMIFSAEGPGATKIIINVKFNHGVSVEGREFIKGSILKEVKPVTYSGNITFNSGRHWEGSSLGVPMTCVSSYALEGWILNSIRAKLLQKHPEAS